MCTAKGSEIEIRDSIKLGKPRILKIDLVDCKT